MSSTSVTSTLTRILRLLLCALLLAALVPTAQAAPEACPCARVSSSRTRPCRPSPSPFRGSLVVTPSQGLTIVGACHTYDVTEGRAMGYAGFALP